MLYTFHNGYKSALNPLATMWQRSPSSFWIIYVYNSALQPFTTFAIVRHYHARQVLAQVTLREEVGIGGACLPQLLD